MALISLKSLGVTMSAPLFSNLDLTIAAGDRLGIAAANGRGKSTLLKCLAGELDASTGDITRSRGLRVGHVEQSVPDALLDRSFHQVVADALSPEQADSEFWRVDVVLDSLDVPEDMRGRPMRALSGGWQRLALIASVWVTDPDVLLLDEPTNHLDLARISLLETWLNALPREVPVIIASHDRAFLDATTNRTLFLRPEESPVFALPYSRAREALEEADASTARRFERDMKVAQQLRRQAAKLNNIGINSGSDLLTVKTKQLKERAEKLEDAAVQAHRERSAGAIRLANRGTHAKVLVTLDDAVVETPDGTLLFRTGKRHICQGDRIVLLGRNGVGKSRFIAMIRSAIAQPGTAQNIKVTPSTVLAYSDQALSGLGGGDTPLAMVSRRFEVGEQRARTLLAGAGVAIEMQEKKISALSGGQRSRLMMLALRLTNPNFYLLDEPTNHLDIDGQEALEEELLKHQASCLLASHDRSFIRAIGNRFWLIEKRRLIEVDSPEEFFRSVTGTER
ncbi:ABC-F family ATP-binding cassette domain-containing protein [Mesorhizobium sp. M1C.F.Ca.ET.193.01.1.1]|uniref:ABC-F family ATP-binding cassette domain-containing protein n=1 Tax=unclassified Mesorhizobium TaxID=325217 RepID=UPI000FD48CDB|nr:MULTISPECIES: ABC-F family ATP-binding cassette domain-containing protein [unclassified Mesorhizobium]TGT02141.1 ABC-F family ATP-binding cassette domain-containing protein [bacterium M00.F.Ca.ET.177.01.1.1]TGQ54393.1 ABC-F family ATP-binding cassette domain-containing protein [Mesorhizobium sp. M1C.F.Ca.ET.210.01.1.1]TGQ72389.1 ABC-F family ATP-binding cassette domain-containing protein [Mesorhizobium sp. M1C.F.Ca.ET.212.01.1.1]TGR10185.1 ABC-F family ATP-binding cassette domain-containing 